MYWLWIFLILIAWIAGMTFSICVLYAAKNPENHPDSLGAMLIHVYITGLPAVVFVFTAIVIRAVGEVSLPAVLLSIGIWAVVFELILAFVKYKTRKERAENPHAGVDERMLRVWFEMVPLFVIAVMCGAWFLFYEYRGLFYIFLGALLFFMFVYPVLMTFVRILTVRLQCPPERMAAKIWDGPLGMGVEVHSETDVHKDPQDHKEEVFFLTNLSDHLKSDMGPAYKFGSVETRKDYLDACLRRAQGVMKSLSGWEYADVLDYRIFRSRIDLRCHFTDGESRVVKLGWKRRNFAKERLSAEDQEIIRIAEQFRNVTLTARLGYVLRCIETYLAAISVSAFDGYLNTFWESASTEEWSSDHIGRGPSVALIPGIKPEQKDAIEKLFSVATELICDHSSWLGIFERGEYITSWAIREVTKVLADCGIKAPEPAFAEPFLFERDALVIKGERKIKEAWGFGPQVKSLSLTKK